MSQCPLAAVSGDNNRLFGTILAGDPHSPTLLEIWGKVGGAEEDRTPDLSVANAALSQLSYGPTVSTPDDKPWGSSGADNGFGTPLCQAI